jgi:GMP reductase
MFLSNIILFMKLSLDTKLDFNDVLILPRQNGLVSRNDVNLERTIHFVNSNRTWTGIPIMVANMDTTGTIKMALTLQKQHILTCLHKFISIDDLLENIENLDRNYFAVSCGTRPADLANFDEIMAKITPHFICLDVANGYLTNVLDIIKLIHTKYPNVTIIAGNVVTPDLVKLYFENGADIIKMGIGSGSVCTTRLQTGIGYPQFSCIMDTKPNIPENCYIISDGGIQTIGDFSKAYGAGADFVMSGGLFAGHDECSGEVVEENGVLYNIFYGMSSAKAMNNHYGSMAAYRSAEGKCVKIKNKASVNNTILDILGGIRSTMTYIGATNISEIYSKCDFIKVNNQANRIFTGKEV